MSFFLSSNKVIVDDFEDNDVSEYNTFNVNQWTTTTNSYHNSYAGLLENSTDGSSQALANTSSGLNATPSQGYTFKCYAYIVDGGGTPAFLWGVQDITTQDPDCYFFTLHDDSSKAQLLKSSGGTESLLQGKSYNWSTGVWYEIVIQWASDGTITATVYQGGTQEVQISATDTSFSSGGIGFDASSRGLTPGGNRTRWDYYHIL